MTASHDPGLDGLLDLDGQAYWLDEAGLYWVKFTIKRVPASEAKPHGLDYSLTLHGPDSGDPKDSRLVGFDNAHAVAETGAPGAGKKRPAWDHKHRLRTVRPYDYMSAEALVFDFWEQVYRILDERGVGHD